MCVATIEGFQKNKKRQTSLLNYEAEHLGRDPEARNSIFIIWQISFDDIRQRWPSAAELLSLMNFFDRQGIVKEVLKIPVKGERARQAGKQDEDSDKDDGKTKD